jgi:hypothetical protein
MLNDPGSSPGLKLQRDNRVFRGTHLFCRLPLLSVFLLLSVSYGHAEELTPTDLNAILQNIPAKCQTSSPDFETQLYCSQTYFLINGKLVNPMIIKDLTPQVEVDDQPPVVSIDLLADGGRYSYRKEDLKIEKRGENLFVEVPWPLESPYQRFSYEILGKTANGIFVLKVIEAGIIEAGGGSGQISQLLFVRIREDKGYDDTFSLNRKRLLVEALGRYQLGDRIISTVAIDGNSLLIEKKEWLPPHDESKEEIMLE